MADPKQVSPEPEPEGCGIVITTGPATDHPCIEPDAKICGEPKKKRNPEDYYSVD